jgi:tetratricopeptide (TPR) repeat protein
VFAANAYIAVPITIDANAIQTQLETLDPATIAHQGTNIAAALRRTAECFPKGSVAGNVAILISDGENHEEGISAVCKELKENNIALLTVGVGTEEGGNIIDTETMQAKTDEEGKVVTTKLNADALESIANKANGEYISLDNSQSALEKVSSALSAIEQIESNNLASNSTNYYSWFLLSAIVLYCLSLALPWWMFRNKKSIALLIFCLVSIHGFSQNANQHLKKGNQFFEQKKYDEAKTEYKKIIANPTNTNLQNAKALYNMGNAFCKQKKWEEAIAQYEKSLALLPADINTRYNLNYAKNKLQKQNQQQQKEQKQQQQQQQQQKQQQKPEPQKPQQQPKPQQGSMSKQEAEQILKALKHEEKNIIKRQKGRQPQEQKNTKDW